MLERLLLTVLFGHSLLTTWMKRICLRKFGWQ